MINVTFSFFGSRANTLDTSEYIQLLHAIGVLPAKAGMEVVIPGVQVQQFGHKVNISSLLSFRCHCLL